MHDAENIWTIWACSAGQVSAGFGLFQLILSHITRFNQPKSAEILPAELDLYPKHVCMTTSLVSLSAIRNLCHTCTRDLFAGKFADASSTACKAKFTEKEKKNTLFGSF
jgi:hypothetical protein